MIIVVFLAQVVTLFFIWRLVRQINQAQHRIMAMEEARDAVLDDLKRDADLLSEKQADLARDWEEKQAVLAAALADKQAELAVVVAEAAEKARVAISTQLIMAETGRRHLATQLTEIDHKLEINTELTVKAAKQADGAVEATTKQNKAVTGALTEATATMTKTVTTMDAVNHTNEKLLKLTKVIEQVQANVEAQPEQTNEASNLAKDTNTRVRAVEAQTVPEVNSTGVPLAVDTNERVRTVEEQVVQNTQDAKDLTKKVDDHTEALKDGNLLKD